MYKTSHIVLDISVSAETSASPEQVLAAVSDVSGERVKVWPNSKPQYFQIHEQGTKLRRGDRGLPSTLWPRLGTEPLRMGAGSDPPDRHQLQRAHAGQYLGAQGLAGWRRQ